MSFTETVPQSQRRYLQTAIISTQEMLIAVLMQPKRKQSREGIARLNWLLDHWNAELENLDAEQGKPPVPMNPALNEHGRLHA